MNQIAFDPAPMMDAGMSRKEAERRTRRERDAQLRALRDEGRKVFGFTLRDQWRKYLSFGNEDTLIRHVYYIDSVNG